MYLKLSLFSSPRLVNTLPKLRNSKECRVWPLMLLAAMPVKEALATIGLSGSLSKFFLNKYSTNPLKSAMSFDLPVPKITNSQL